MEEISSAGLTKGIDYEGKRTSYFKATTGIIAVYGSLVTFLLAFLGAYLGYYILRKHLKEA